MKGLVVFQHNQKCVNSEGKLYHKKSGKHDKHINKRFPFVNLLRSVWLSFSILDIHQESKMRQKTGFVKPSTSSIFHYSPCWAISQQLLSIKSLTANYMKIFCDYISFFFASNACRPICPPLFTEQDYWLIRLLTLEVCICINQEAPFSVTQHECRQMHDPCICRLPIICENHK